MPKKWQDIYPHGTKEGDEEWKFFVALERHKKWDWRSVSALSKETGLTKERVEEIAEKYRKLGLVFQNPKNDDHWGYWERVPHMVPKPVPSITKKDHDDRLRRHLGDSDVFSLVED